MRIALVSVSGRLGGSEVVLLDLVSEIRRARPAWDVHLVCPGDGPLASCAARRGAHVHLVPMPAAVARLGDWGGRARVAAMLSQLAGGLRAWRPYERRFARALDDIRPDVLHTNGFKAHLVAARVRTAAARLWHIHEYVSGRPLTRELLRRYAAVPRAIVANSASVAADVDLVTRTRRRATIETIRNGVDLERFAATGPAADLDAACGLPPAGAGSVRVGLAATFARWKGHDLFFRALAQIPGDVLLRGYVIGGPVYDTSGSQWTIDELRAAARRAGVEDRVGFTDFQTDMPAVLRALDIVVHASTRPEPFGLVVAEAMACGKPVITSGEGGTAEIIRPGITALVHSAADATSLAQAIAALARDGVKRAQLGQAGRAVAEADLDIRAFGSAFVRRYESLRGA